MFALLKTTDIKTMRNSRLELDKQQNNPAMYRLAVGLVIGSRLGILITSTQWLLADIFLSFLVGIVSFFLTFVPQALIQDRALSTATRVCVSLLLCAHILLGMHLGLYETSIIYDKLMHILGTGAITGLVLLVAVQYSHRRQLNLPQTFMLLLVLGLAISAGTLWEVFEFVMNRTGLFYSQRGLHDTMLDLIADAIGAIITLALYAGIMRLNGFILKSRSY